MTVQCTCTSLQANTQVYFNRLSLSAIDRPDQWSAISPDQPMAWLGHWPMYHRLWFKKYIFPPPSLSMLYPFPDCLTIPHSIPAAISSHPTRPPTHAHSFQQTFFAKRTASNVRMMWKICGHFCTGDICSKKIRLLSVLKYVFSGETGWERGRGGQLPKQRQERFTWCILSERVQGQPPPSL